MDETKKDNGIEGIEPKEEEVIPYVPENGDAEVVEMVQYDPHILERLEITHKAALRAIEMIDELVKTSLRMTRERHWYDYEGRPYLKEQGVMIVKRGLPVEIKPTGPMKFQTFEDEKGAYYIASLPVRASWTNGMFGSVEAIGTASSRDPLVFKKRGEEVPLAEIDRTKVMRKADSNGRRRALCRLLGIDDMSWDDFEALTGVKRDSLERIEYGGEGSDKSRHWKKEEQEKADKMRSMILEMTGGNAQRAQEYLEALTTWTPRGKSEPVKGKRQIKELSGKQIEINFGKVEKDYASFMKGQDRKAAEEAKKDGLFE